MASKENDAYLRKLEESIANARASGDTWKEEYLVESRRIVAEQMEADEDPRGDD